MENNPNVHHNWIDKQQSVQTINFQQSQEWTSITTTPQHPGMNLSHYAVRKKRKILKSLAMLR